MHSTQEEAETWITLNCPYAASNVPHESSIIWSPNKDTFLLLIKFGRGLYCALFDKGVDNKRRLKGAQEVVTEVVKEV